MRYPTAILNIISDASQNDLILSDESISFYSNMLKSIGISSDEQHHVLQMCQKQFDAVIKPLIKMTDNKGEIKVEFNECFSTTQRKYEFLYRYYSNCT